MVKHPRILLGRECESSSTYVVECDDRCDKSLEDRDWGYRTSIMVHKHFDGENQPIIQAYTTLPIWETPFIVFDGYYIQIPNYTPKKLYSIAREIASSLASRFSWPFIDCTKESFKIDRNEQRRIRTQIKRACLKNLGELEEELSLNFIETKRVQKELFLSFLGKYPA